MNGMMDPELIKLAQEQMSRMSPNDLARMQQQMMANPELMRMATESMKGLSPADLRTAAEQLKHARPEEMSEITEKMANASPDEIASMRSRLDAQIAYELNAAQMLKKQGNELHSLGKFRDASEKYVLAKKNVKAIPTSKGRTLLLACSLNLMSCYLKTKKYDECIKEGSEVLEYDEKNVKALYRRGQAYKEMGLLEDAVTDLSKALEVSPHDETIIDVLRDAKSKMTKEGGEQVSRGLKIEEMSEEMPTVSSENISSTTEYSVIRPRETSGCSTSQSENNNGSLSSNSQFLHALKDDPETIRSFQNFMSKADPGTLGALSAGKVGDLPPEMLKTASNMISKMSPDELQKMLQMASSLPDSNFKNFRPGSGTPNVTPDMMKTATDMMRNMPAEDLQKMYSMTSTLGRREGDSFPAESLDTNGSNTDTRLRASELREASAISEGSVEGESSGPNGLFSSMGSAPSGSMFSPSAENFQEQMQNQMRDPAMRQMFTSMIKNMSPDMMSNMGEQFGFKLSKEDAEKAQQAMSSLSPEALDKMMRWADRLQRGAECARKTKNWFLGRPGMILAIFMLIFAIILHRLGYIGS